MGPGGRLAWCAGLVCLALAAPAQASPNFVVILSDDQSWVGSSVPMDPDDARSRSDYYRTPHLERLAERGMRFSRGYAPAPFCAPTRRALLVGQTPARHVYQQDREGWPQRYRQQLSLPRMLKQADPAYRTAHFGKWDFRFDGVTPEEMGYDESDGPTTNAEGLGRGTGGPAAKSDPKSIFGITERSADFMRRSAAAGQPFFVQVSHYAVHLDVYYREESLDAVRRWKPGSRHAMPGFAAMTRDLDEGLGSLLDAIDALGVADDTYVFFLSDNGGRRRLPGQQDLELGRNHPLRSGKGSMYEGGLRVPFLVAGPGIAAGSTSRVAVTALDLLPTLAELAGRGEPLPASLDGGSLAGLLRSRGQGVVSRRDPFLIFHQAVDRKPQSALIEGRYKLVKTWKQGRLELFDPSRDPGESQDLSRELPDETQELHARLVRFLDEVGAETRQTQPKGRGKRR